MYNNAASLYSPTNSFISAISGVCNFGTKMVWGSDFPVAKLATTYRQTLENFRTHCDFVSEKDKSEILGGTLSKILSWARPI